MQGPNFPFVLSYSPLAPEQGLWAAQTSRKGLAWTSRDQLQAGWVEVLGDGGVVSGHRPLAELEPGLPRGGVEGHLTALREPHCSSLPLADCEYQFWGQPRRAVGAAAEALAWEAMRESE